MIESSRTHGPFDSRYPHKHSRLTFVPASARRTTGEAALVSGALQAWEGEGGAALEPRTRSRRSRPVVQAPGQAGIG
jgi:hypothetical protein